MNNKQNGFVQVYTGSGKGKTTAAIGLSIRAVGAGKRVLFMQFMKSKDYSEHKVISAISDKLELITIGKPYFIAEEGALSKELYEEYKNVCLVFSPGSPPEEYVTLVKEAIQRANEAASNGDYDLVVLDEINCALYFGLAKWDDVKEIILKKHPNTELVLTGRCAPNELIEIADLVTEMKEIKHYYNTMGILARKGIEN